MNTELINNIVVITSDVPVIVDKASALDLIMSCAYEKGTRLIVIEKTAFAADFFKLSTSLAGGIVQKFANYRFRVAVFGDFSGYTSAPLKAFMAESNRGKVIHFVPNEQEAVALLSAQ
jgi:hypothetical protein